MGGDKNAIWIQSGDNKILFDIVIPTPKGALYVMYMKRTGVVENEMVNVNHGKLTIQQVHERLGHCNEDMTRKSAKALGLDLSRGGLAPCAAYTAGKVKQKNVPKDNEHVPSVENNCRIFLDIATIKKVKDGPSVSRPNWRIMVDERTNLKLSAFYQTKKGMVEPTCEQFYRWKQAGQPVKYVRLDNAGKTRHTRPAQKGTPSSNLLRGVPLSETTSLSWDFRCWPTDEGRSCIVRIYRSLCATSYGVTLLKLSLC
jgi:hypothetical protein